MRIEPPPSPPEAIGTMRDATAAPLPPLDPPAVCPGFHGLQVAPKASGSVMPIKPNSGVLVLPKIFTPVCLKRLTKVASSWGMIP